MYTSIGKLASAIRNDIIGGLRGYHSNLSMSMEQLEQDIIDERLLILKEYALKGILPLKDLYLSINCIPVDCLSIDRCTCNIDEMCEDEEVAHFLIPLLMNDYGIDAVDYIGSTDRLNSFIVYTSMKSFKTRKYRKRGKNKPFVYIDTTPNSSGLCDCFIFNAPLINNVSITAIFKDPRQISNFICSDNCSEEQGGDNLTFLDAEIKSRVTKKKLAYYRQAAPATLPNDQQYLPG